MQTEITISDLRRGAVVRLTEKQYAALRGCSASLIQKERGSGKGIPFLRTRTGRIFYAAEDVLTELDNDAKHVSTCEYPQTQSAKNIEKARTRDASQKPAKKKQSA